MTLTSPNINYLWADIIVEELARCGVTSFIVCPGSRSSPLALAIARNPKAQALTHFDERGAAFFALGQVSATGAPVAILCTSGTAAANFLPAAIECSKKKLPLIVLTADRPPELRQTGADQAIEQVGIFGPYVRFQVDLPCPSTDIPAPMPLTTVDQAVYRATRSVAGPVHLNCMFREPLAPIKTGDDFKDYVSGLSAWLKSDRPYTQYHSPVGEVSHEAVGKVAGILKANERGLIVVGKLRSQKERAAVLSLAGKLQWPVLADVTSGLRLTSSKGPVVHYFDQLLLSPHLADLLKVDCVLQLGGRMTSKRLNQLVQDSRPRNYVMVLSHPLRNDPAHQVTLRVEAPIASFCAGIARAVKARRKSAWLRSIVQLSDVAGRQIRSLAEKSLSEPSVAYHVSRNIPSGHGLFLANSMPVRDMDMYGAVRPGDIIIGANRGASGIDGTIATACGFSQGSGRPVTLVIGDISALYDLNSLALLRSLKRPMTLVVLNNDGCGVFSFLPVGQFKKDFEQCFGAPHGLSFKDAARMFGLRYARPRTTAEFLRSYQQAASGDRHTLIEVVTNRQDNLQLHQDWQESLRALVESKLTVI
ncbi:MAG: 2-succinyl-5-enolpyruvyl-6-hydroxy-3-cyclohexene-1-carboxylic-acid synthase [Candidatus Omnitrophica bacterium]|nr:2-succinyl-5-enolpyruvyl-6-hydroxy-3-cyclohexene-1-carboxylic-acid synthase [Candidatus Omnitrophota bacterium]